MTNTCPFTQTLQSVGLIIPHIVAAHSFGGNTSVATLSNAFVVPGVQCTPVLVGAGLPYTTSNGSPIITMGSIAGAANGMQLIGQGIGSAITISSFTTTAPFTITMTAATGVTSGVNLTGQIMGIPANVGSTANLYGGPQHLCTAGTDGSILKAIRIASTDTADKNVAIWIQPGGTGVLQLVGVVNVPATSGFSATGILPPVDVLGNPYMSGLTTDQTGLPVLPLASGTKVYCSLMVALTNYKALHITATLENF